MKDRQLDSASMLGFACDAIPTKEEVQFYKDASGGLPWVCHAHHGWAEMYGIAKMGYYTHVWGGTYAGDTALFGWKGQFQHAHFNRGDNNGAPPARWRTSAEIEITGSQRGIGRLGADYWPVLKDKNGKRVGNVSDRFPESQWRNLELITYLLAPGVDGPIVTPRFEAVREGVHECEARIYLEAALTDKALKGKLGEDLAGRIQQTLDERIRYMWKGNSSLLLTYHSWSWGYVGQPWSRQDDSGLSWFLSTGWQERSEKLYALAAEVQKKLAAK
jgi:hypothetical protein